MAVRTDHLHIRVAPSVKEELSRLAESERRSLSDMMEILIHSEYFMRMQTDKEFARRFK